MSNANEVKIEFTSERIRQIAAKVRKDQGGFTTAQAEAFLALYAGKLTDLLETCATEFITRKLR